MDTTPLLAKMTLSTLLSLGLPVLASAALYDQIIETETGPVYGYPAFNSTPTDGLTNWEDIAVWKGIPFAADTSGEVSDSDPQEFKF